MMLLLFFKPSFIITNGQDEARGRICENQKGYKTFLNNHDFIYRGDLPTLYYL